MSILIRHVYLDNQFMDILINQNRFERIAPHIPTAALDHVIEAEGKAILPAFYNMHTHAAMVLLRGIGEDKDLFAWLTEDIWPLEQKLDAPMVYDASRMAVLEMIKSGTVFFNDMYFIMNKTIQAVDEMGIRAAIAPVAMDLFDSQQTILKKQSMAAFMAEPCICPRIIKAVACHAVYTVSDELLDFSRDLAKRYNTFLHIHSSETQKEVTDCLSKTGLTPTQKLHKHGLIGNKTVLAHCVYLSEEDKQLIHKAGALIAHCPISNLKLNSGQMPLASYQKENLLLSLGTDGASSNNSLSLFSEMKTAALSAKGQAHEITAAPIDSIRQMACENGATFMGLKAGQIKEGYLADFMLIDLSNPLTHPLSALNSHFIYSIDSSCITDVCCDGKFVMKDKIVPNQNEIIDSFEKTYRRLMR